MILYQLFYKKIEDLGVYPTEESAENAAHVDAKERYQINFRSPETFWRNGISAAYTIKEIEQEEPKKKQPKREKEFLYIGHYMDTKGRYILKIGTTNNLERRRKEHTWRYREAKMYTMPIDGKFIYDWHIKLSKYNTLRFEDLNREKWKKIGIGEFVRNDRFACERKPQSVEIIIRKTYIIAL